MKIFLVLLFSSVVWAVPFNVEVVKKGDGDEIRSGQLIKVHYKGYLYADIVKFDSLKVAAAAESAEKAKQDSIAAAAKKDSKSKAKDKKAEAPVEAAAADSAVVDEASADTLTPFADTYASGEPLEFTIGVGQVIAGWDKGILGMKVGEIRKLTIPYVMAYGENSLEGIPPYSDLYFEVELVAAEKPLEADVFPKDLNKLKWQDKGKGLKVFDEKAGTGKPATQGTNLKVHYTGWLVSGRKFGSSKDLGKPFEVVLGAGKMIKGWEAGLDGMREGGVRWLRVSPSMGYGASAFTMIPPNSTLVFRIELVESMIDPEIAAKMDFFPDTTTLTFEHGSEGLRYAVIQQGEGEPAKAGANVKVHYTGWLTNGYKFDSSRDRDQAFAFPLGGGRVIRGWDLGVAGMLPGEKRILIIPPGLGYGSRGAGPIPGGATLIFAVEYLGE
ncbi:FKBP-type peptidyl-prolyl cis-trans isomerase [Fibrobacter succinogenes]|uniref:FKBP-type peptidyl-prolyl cis-trans isomerase n=1 Tax=Fibrobacter succinogenes TaxID=833 RepID=UPI001564D61E|nr:FKBP-type peptidyl-prolyl cis-trans isomerase [Fibrobacter succinogenes]